MNCGRCPVHFEPGETKYLIQSPGGARFQKPQLNRAAEQIRKETP